MSGIQQLLTVMCFTGRIIMYMYTTEIQSKLFQRMKTQGFLQISNARGIITC